MKRLRTKLASKVRHQHRHSPEVQRTQTSNELEQTRMNDDAKSSEPDSAEETQTLDQDYAALSIGAPRNAEQYLGIVEACPHCATFKEGIEMASRNHPQHIKPTQDRAYEFFHKPCEQCDRHRDEPDEFLCDFCRHARLRHLSFCLLAPRDKEGMQAPIQVAWPKNHAWQHPCKMCYFMAYVCKTQVSEMGAYDAVKLVRGEQGFRRWRRDTSKTPDWEIHHYPIGAMPDVFLAQRIESAKSQLLKPLIEDWGKMRRWLRECDEQHSTCARPMEGLGSLSGELPNGFRVIDVVQRRVIRPTSGVRFVALSYVWGKSLSEHLLQATKASLKELEEMGGIHPERTPKTIEDAMTVCKQLGETYLWADRLCIVQDDASTKKQQIDAMDQVYAAATLTLIACRGLDMDSGLSGVSFQRDQQAHVAFGGITATQVREVHAATIRRSYWDSRAWTYQEAVLSRRKIFFGREVACFECPKTIQYEDLYTELYEGPKKDPAMGFYDLSLLQPIERYACAFRRHLNIYYQRGLTNPADIINGFRGILNALYTSQNIYFGLPQPCFDEALLITDQASSNLRGQTLSKVVSQDVTLPSWSWASFSWTRLQLEDYRFQGTLICSWKISDESPHRHEVIEATESPLSWRPDIPKKGGQDWRMQQKILPRVYLALSWILGCIETRAPSSWDAADYADLDDGLDSRWTSYQKYWKELLERTTDPDEEMLSHLKPGVICFRAQTAFLKLGSRAANGEYHNILSPEGESIGFVLCKASHFQNHIVEVSQDSYEFVAMSLSAANPADFEKTGSSQSRKPSESLTIPRDNLGQPMIPIPIVNTLMIRRDEGNPLAYRVAVAYIPLTIWAKVRDPQFRTILLA